MSIFLLLNLCNTLINWTGAFLVEEVVLGGVGTKQKDKGRKLSGSSKSNRPMSTTSYFAWDQFTVIMRMGPQKIT